MKKNNKAIPRPEYPRPGLVRKEWCNLNGEWAFEIDGGVSGSARKLQCAETLSGRITVPFCPESSLSGVGNKDYMPSVWYKKKIELTEKELSDGKRVIIHFGACDYETILFVNGKLAGKHIGGYVSFSFDITGFVKAGENDISVWAKDDNRSTNQPAGKQSPRYGSYGCFYTRTTGIWQTVWYEIVPAAYIVRTKYTPDISGKKLLCEVFCDGADGMTVTAAARYEGKKVGKGSAVVSGRYASMMIELSELHLWEVGCGRLYDLELNLGEDRVSSYFGMREVAIKDEKMYINGSPVFQRLVLDQGFYPDGIYTAPSDAELCSDIQRSLDMGFNGARLHQKIFEERFLYHADRMGYIVWGEEGNWVLNIAKPECWQGFIPEWTEEIERDYNHPSIVGWCPLNETQSDQNEYFVRFLVDITHKLDPTRPCIDSSGWFHVGNLADLYDAHDYDQNPETFRERYAALANGGTIVCHVKKTVGRPVFVSEYGGIWWNPEDPNGWGYGTRVASEEEFIARYRGLADALLDNENICALCYTQLTDVEQEQNGLYTYDRRPKFPAEVMAPIMRRRAAIEK